MFTKIKAALTSRKNVAETKGALDEPTEPVTPLDEATVSVGSGVGKAVVKRPSYASGESVTLSYVSNFSRSYDAGPITLTVEEWDNLVEAVESVLAKKPAVEVSFL